MRALVRAIVLVVGVAWCVVGSAGAEPPATRPAVAVGGAWKGVFCQDNSVFLADLTLDDAGGGGGGAITGELHFTSVLGSMGVARTARPVEGGWRVTAVVEAGSRTVTISPLAGTRPAAPVSPMQMQPMPPQVMAAVYVAAGDELAGQWQPKFARQDVAPNYFLFERPAKAEAMQRLADRAASLALPVRAARPVRGAQAAPAVTAPGPDELKAWAKRYEEEYPGRATVDPTEKLAMQAMPLLNDATFKPLFGERYDAVDVQVLLEAIQRARGMPLRGPNGLPVGRQDFDFSRQYGYLEYVIRPTPPRTIAVAAMRAIDAWEAEQVERFQKGDASANTFDEMAATQKAIHERVVYAWPSDRKKTDELFEKMRGSHAGEGLMASVDKAVGGASGIAGAQALAGWAKANASALEHASVADREAATGKVNERLDALLKEAMEPEVAKLAALSAGGGDALGRGVVWYENVTKQFAFAKDRPPVREAIAQLLKRRPQDIIDGRAMMVAAIARARSDNEIDLFFARDLGVPGDQDAPGYAVLAEAAKQRKADIEKEKILATYSERERAMMDPTRPGHLLLAKMNPNVAPTAEEVRLAVLRGWAFGNGKMIDANTARHVSMVNPPVPIPFPFPIHINITNERLVDPMPKRLKDSDLWEVHYKMRMKIEFPKDNPLASYDRETRKGYDMMAEMVNKASDAVDDTYAQQLRLYEDGWGVPELRAAGAADGVLGQLMKVR